MQATIVCTEINIYNLRITTKTLKKLKNWNLFTKIIQIKHLKHLKETNTIKKQIKMQATIVCTEINIYNLRITTKTLKKLKIKTNLQKSSK